MSKHQKILDRKVKVLVIKEKAIGKEGECLNGKYNCIPDVRLQCGIPEDGSCMLLGPWI